MRRIAATTKIFSRQLISRNNIGTPRWLSGSSGQIAVMMNGLPGAMGVEVSQACLRRGLDLAPMALTGPDMPADCEVVEGDKKVAVKLVGPGSTQKDAVAEMQAKYGSGLIIVDFTHPTAVNPNVDIYTALKCPFVMGTTGGDRPKMMKDAEDRQTYAVIAPNMCKQIVAFQATMENMAKAYPGAFGGYKMELIESHQSTKADTSGTAKAMVASFNGLGIKPEFKIADIEKIRTEDAQLAFTVPKEHLAGHAYHTYRLTSADGSVQFEFKHNVNGRRTYAEGVADAVQFLTQKIQAKSEKRVFNMIDVLAEGAMTDDL